MVCATTWLKQAQVLGWFDFNIKNKTESSIQHNSKIKCHFGAEGVTHSFKQFDQGV